jgi:hypothetical protein
MSYCEFSAILGTKTLRFVHPFTWSDNCEGFFFQCLKNPEIRDEMQDVISKISPKAKIDIEKYGFDTLLNKVRAICFTKSRDCAEMWSKYDYGETAIMIEIDAERIKRLNEHGYQNNYVGLFPINYVGELSLEDEARQAIHEEWISARALFTTKRTVFQFENEVRALIAMNKTPSSHLESVNLKIPNLSALTGVMVHPSAQDDYIERVRTECENRNLTWLGKSNQII